MNGVTGPTTPPATPRANPAQVPGAPVLTRDVARPVVNAAEFAAVAAGGVNALLEARAIELLVETGHRAPLGPTPPQP